MATQQIKLAGFDHNDTCHFCRQNTTTTMLDYGADLIHIQEMLVHASILTTQLYTHVRGKKLSEYYEATHPSAEGGSGLL